MYYVGGGRLSGQSTDRPGAADEGRGGEEDAQHRDLLGPQDVAPAEPSGRSGQGERGFLEATFPHPGRAHVRRRCGSVLLL